jgi:hypothetical protein
VSSNLISVFEDAVAQLVEQCLIFPSSVNFRDHLASKRVTKHNKTDEGTRGGGVSGVLDSALQYSFDCQLGLHRLLNVGERYDLDIPSSNSFL